MANLDRHEVTSEAASLQEIVMQMVVGASVSKTISAVTRLNVPDVLQRIYQASEPLLGEVLELIHLRKANQVDPVETF